MHCTKKITSDLVWLGGSDRRLALFENVYPIPRGVSYNAYLIRDEKTALLDTVDQAIAERFFENLEYALQGKPLNYVIVNHMEPDHAATLGETLSRHPEAVVIGNAKTLPMIRQFFPMEVEGRFQAVKEGDTLSPVSYTHLPFQPSHFLCGRDFQRRWNDAVCSFGMVWTAGADGAQKEEAY